MKTEFQSLDEMKGPPSRSPLHPLYYCTEYGQAYVRYNSVLYQAHVQ